MSLGFYKQSHVVKLHSCVAGPVNLSGLFFIYQSFKLVINYAAKWSLGFASCVYIQEKLLI